MDQCISSILGQTYPDFELILVDDGSPDRCGVMINEWAEKDSRIRVIHQENRGISAARNAGIATSKGDYLAFVDSDDWIADNMLETLYRLATIHNADMVLCNFMYVSEDGEKSAAVCHARPGIYGQEEFWNSFFSINSNRTVYEVAWNKLYRKELFSKIRYPIGKIYEDSRVLYDLVSLCDQIVITDEIGYYYRRRSTGIVRSRNNKYLPNMDLLEVKLDRVDQFIRDEKWMFAGNMLCITMYGLLDSPAFMKETRQYKKIRERMYRFYIKLFPYLPVTRKISILFFLVSPKLLRSLERFVKRDNSVTEELSF